MSSILLGGTVAGVGDVGRLRTRSPRPSFFNGLEEGLLTFRDECLMSEEGGGGETVAENSITTVI